MLTGTINGYSCAQAPRGDSSQYDYLYHLPHHQALSGGWPLHDARASQMLDGIIDVYGDRVRFGLMTGDFDDNPDTEMRGMYSYADDRRFRQAGCLFPNSPAASDSFSLCLLYTSDAADERSSVDLGGRRIIKKKKKIELRGPVWLTTKHIKQRKEQ